MVKGGLMGFISACIIGAACSYIASTKNRNELLWFFLGVFFHVIALTIILILSGPDKPREQSSNDCNRYQYEDYK